MSDIVERLHTVALDAYLTPEQWEVIEEVKAEIKRLRAIVDRLPVTADGVRVADGDEVFTLDGQCVQARIQLVYHQLPNSIEDCYQPVLCCYSTREASEAAAKETP